MILHSDDFKYTLLALLTEYSCQEPTDLQI